LLSNKEDAVGKLREPLLECSLPAALEAMGERWSFLILRASFNGLHHFEEFQSELGIARNILASMGSWSGSLFRRIDARSPMV
jgi:DNA-binding HxlR family transcriptional regulator